jgi:hypothetical protein
MLPLIKNSRSSLIIVDMQNFFFRQAERQYTRSELLTYLDHDRKNARQLLKI